MYFPQPLGETVFPPHASQLQHTQDVPPIGLGIIPLGEQPSYGSSTTVEQVPSFSSSSDDICVICFESYHQRVAVEPCEHNFCYRCVRLSVVCPLCRGNIVKFKRVSETKIDELVREESSSQAVADEESIMTWYSYNLTRSEFDGICGQFKELDISGTGRLGQKEVTELIKYVSGGTPPSGEEIGALFSTLANDSRECALDCEKSVRLPYLLKWVSYNRPKVLEEHQRKELRDLRRKRNEERRAQLSAKSDVGKKDVVQSEAGISGMSSLLMPEISTAPSVASLMDQYKLASNFKETNGVVYY